MALPGGSHGGALGGIAGTTSSAVYMCRSSEGLALRWTRCPDLGWDPRRPVMRWPPFARVVFGLAGRDTSTAAAGRRQRAEWLRMLPAVATRHLWFSSATCAS